MHICNRIFINIEYTMITDGMGLVTKHSINVSKKASVVLANCLFVLGDISRGILTVVH